MSYLSLRNICFMFVIIFCTGSYANEFQKAVRLLTSNAPTEVKKAEAYLKKRDNLSAKETLKIAVIYFENKSWKKSLTWFEKYDMQFTPPNLHVLALAKGLQGRAYIKAGKADLAFQICHSHQQLISLSQYGNDLAICLGELYRDGAGVKKDRDKAIFWFEQAANRHNNEALFELNGLKTQKD